MAEATKHMLPNQDAGSAEHAQAVIKDIDDVIDYFLDRQGDPAYSGFERTAELVRRNLDFLHKVPNDESDSKMNLKLPIRPPADGDPFHFAVGTESQGTIELMLMLESITHARIIPELSYNNAELGDWGEVRHGHYKGATIYLTTQERYGTVTMHASLSPRSDSVQEVITAAENLRRQNLNRQFGRQLQEIIEMPTAQISEEDIVRNWTRQRHYKGGKP